MSRLPVLVAHSLVITFFLAAGAAVAGSVTGTVTFADPVPRLPMLDMSADPACAEKHSEPVQSRVLVLGEGKTLANVLVTVKNAPAVDSATPKEPVVVDQRGCLYLPRVVAARVGQKVLFKNSDGILHNVRGLPSDNKAFNKAMPAMIKETGLTFDQAEAAFEVRCDVHPWMQAWVAVMTHPFYAVTREDGKFRIEGLPAGTWEIEAWHERLGTMSTEVEVGASGAVSADFSFKVPKR